MASQVPCSSWSTFMDNQEFILTSLLDRVCDQKYDPSPSPNMSN